MHSKHFYLQLSFFCRCFIYLSSLYFLYVLPAQAQYEENDFVRYTVKEGLSHNYVTCLQQDDWGYMWVGTDLGLNRFDGNSFTNYYQGAKPFPLPSSTVRNIKKFDLHHLGIFTRRGFQMLNTKDLSFQNYFIPDSTAFTTHRNAAWDAIALPNRSLALTTASGFYVFNETGQLIFRHDAHSLEDIGKKTILYGRNIISVNDKEYLIFIEEHGLAYYNSEKKLFREISKEDKQWANFYPVAPKENRGLINFYQVNKDEFIFFHFARNSIVYYNKPLNKTVVTPLTFPKIEFSWESKINLLNDTSFAVNGANSGFYLLHINKQSGKITFNPKKFLSDHKIQCLYLDKDKRLWVGTSKGLLRQKLSVPFLSSYLFQPMPSDSVTGGFSCAYRYKNKLYLGRFSRNRGLLIVDILQKK
jgi:ligand-binding sensor domain-containing protein